jgi:hypothetical protein
MKTTTVPAQVTTIEDKIAGRLGLTQLLLLTIPIFIAGMIFAILPHRMHAAPYKYVLSGFVCALVGTLAIRIKEKLVLNWCLILFNFYKRPKWYVYDKNNQYCRDLRVVVFELLLTSSFTLLKPLFSKLSKTTTRKSRQY